MKRLAIIVALAVAVAPCAASALRPGGGGGGARGGSMSRGGAPVSRPSSNQGRGFNLGNDVPSTRQNHVGGGNRQGGPNGGNRGNGTISGNNNRNNGNNNRNNVNNRYNGNSNRYTNANVNRNANVNHNTNVNVNRNYTYNRNGYNGYGWHGAVVVNPVYRGPAWGWNHGVVWAPNYGYWGGGFWGAFAVGAASAAVMGSIVYNNQQYTSYQVSSSSPGATLLSNYGLQQVPCGPPGLVVIYGPNNGIICANPNGRVAAGTYAVNENNLTLQSQ